MEDTSRQEEASTGRSRRPGVPRPSQSGGTRWPGPPDDGPAVPAVWPGSPQPLGARFHIDPQGVRGTNFALWAGSAEFVELCLFDQGGQESRHQLTERTQGVWHGFVSGVLPGQAYGYRVHGRWDPWTGARWNPAKLLLDPYARAVDGTFSLPGAVYGHVRDWPEREVADTVRDNRDSAPFVPKGIVVNDGYDWSGTPRPRTAWADSVIYELHVRGFTMRHPGVPEELRGTYAGLAHPAALGHLTDLGVTAVELLPVHQHVSEEHLQRHGMSNYWGYNTIGYFAPHAGYAASGTRGQQVGEFQEMVRALHEAGIEVILDVVYNHTAEAGEHGPTLSLRGIDNAGYYRLAQDPRHYADYTGCGNTLSAARPHTLRMIMDSLRYWVTEMGVDGFRFDLAASLARATWHGPGGDHPDMLSPFLTAVAQDPVLSQVKLIAEPWDVGEGGYQVGAFPAPWSEWNDRYRDAVRDFWRGAHPDVRELGYRLSGSSDLYALSARHPYSSINFVTAHDGFTLRDLVSYERKHNEANGEDNRDGTADNHAWNCGYEGDTRDPAVGSLRRRQMRNLLGTLLLSTGVPMLVAGDEMGHTQGGNNNAYCQDNAISWMDWSLLDSHPENQGWRSLCDLARRLIALRRAHPVLRRQAFFTGLPAGPEGLRDLAWFTARGREMTEGDWFAPTATLGMYLSGRDIPQRGPTGVPVADDSFLVVLHSSSQSMRFTLPGEPWAHAYEVVVDTAREEQSASPGVRYQAGGPLTLAGRSLVLLRAITGDGDTHTASASGGADADSGGTTRPGGGLPRGANRPRVRCRTARPPGASGLAKRHGGRPS